jgi:hypothetical protein
LSAREGIAARLEALDAELEQVTEAEAESGGRGV